MIKHSILHLSLQPTKKKATVKLSSLKNKVQIKCICTYIMILINLELKRIYFVLLLEYYLMNSPSILALKQEKKIFTWHGSAVNSIYSNIDKTIVYWFSTFTSRGKVMKHFFRVTDENVNVKNLHDIGVKV